MLSERQLCPTAPETMHCTAAIFSHQESLKADTSYCGLLTSPVGGVGVAAGTAAGTELEGGNGSAVAGALCDVGAVRCDFGRSGRVVIALSGFSK